MTIQKSWGKNKDQREESTEKKISARHIEEYFHSDLSSNRLLLLSIGVVRSLCLGVCKLELNHDLERTQRGFLVSVNTLKTVWKSLSGPVYAYRHAHYSEKRISDFQRIHKEDPTTRKRSTPLLAGDILIPRWLQEIEALCSPLKPSVHDSSLKIKTTL